MPVVSAEMFAKTMSERLAPEMLERAVTLHREYGPNCSLHVTNLILFSTQQGDDKVKKIVGILEKYLETNLKDQDISVRGTVTNAVGGNETRAMFYRLYQQELDMQPTNA